MTEPPNRAEVTRVTRRVLRRALVASSAFWLLGTAFILWANTGALSVVGPARPGTLGLIGFMLLVGLICLQYWRWTRLVVAVTRDAPAATPVTITFRASAPGLAIVEAANGAGAQDLIVSVMRVTREGRSLGWRRGSTHHAQRPALLYADFAKRVAVGISDDELFVPRRRWVYRPRS